MSNANRHDIHVLNSLIQTAIDSADGYREASTEADDPGRRDLFGRRSFERRQVAEELQSTVRAPKGVVVPETGKAETPADTEA